MTTVNSITIRNILLNESTIKEHIDLQNTHYSEYIANLLLLLYEYNVEFTILKLAKILAVAIFRNDKQFASFLMKDKRFDLPVILKCCNILDSRRLYNQLSKKTEKIKDSKKLSKHKTILSNLQSLNENVDMSLTQSVIKFIKRNWINSIPKERLEYMALLYPVKYWKQLIDLFHLKPNDFQLDWFTGYIFTKECPKDSIINVCNSITTKNITAITIKYKLPFDFIRLKYKKLITAELLEHMVDYIKLSDILRYWFDFSTEYNLHKFINRIDMGEELDMPYGELMKRIHILTEKKESSLIINKLINIAENKLMKYKIDIEQPVVVLGDASGSMEVAIKTSSIITSILVKICNAKMHLFRTTDEHIEFPPTNVPEH